MSSTLFIALLIVLFVIAPILILKWVSKYQTKKDDMKLLQEFDELSKDNQLTICAKEKFGRRIIGLDKFNQKVLFLDKSKEARQVYLFDLRRISFCEIVKTSVATEYPISNLAIQCFFKETDHPAIPLMLFDAHYDNMNNFSNVEKKAERWKQEINIYKGYIMQRFGSESALHNKNH